MSSEKNNLLSQHQRSSAFALERCKSFTFDVNQQAESLNQWEQRYNQHSKGTFSGYLDELKLNGLHFFEEFTNQTLQQQCCVNDNNLWLGFSLQPQRPKINNTTITDGQLMIRPSGIEFELTTPNDFHIYGLVMDKNSLSHQMMEQDNDLWENTSQAMHVSMPNHYVCYELAKLISLLLNNNNSPTGSHKIFSEQHTDRLSRLSPLIASKVADLLAQTTMNDLQMTVSQQTVSRVISHIKNFIKETKHYPLTITELCSISNVSRRTLQYCFEQGMGISPIQYIRDCRLNEVRRLLLDEDNEKSIADLALDFGFFHIATFNAQYKDLFAETPTQTIKRAGNYLHIITAI
jgi:AraC family ethanolamine operon transcriptional activator